MAASLLSGLLCWLALFSGGESFAAAHPVLRVSAEIDPGTRTVVGELEVHLENTTSENLDEVLLWRFPELLGERPVRWDSLTRTRLFPGAFDPAGMEVWDVTLSRAGSESEGIHAVEPGGGPLLEIPLPVALEPGQRLTLRARYRTRIPLRYGPFGAVGEHVTLDGGFFPRPAPLGSSGWSPQSPPDDLCVSLDVGMSSAGEGVLIVNGDLRRMDEAGRRQTFDLGCVQRVSLAWRRGARVFRHDTAGGAVEVVHYRRRHLQASPDTLPDLSAIDSHGLAASAASSALGHLRRVAPRSGATLLMIETPLRRRIARGAVGMMFFSDRSFEVTPVANLQNLHEQDVARAAFSTLLAPEVLARERRRIRDRVLGLLAADLTQQWRALTRRSRRTMRELLGPADFVRAVDEVIYAPQVPFHSTYFPVIDDADPLRQDLTLFSHAHPSGRLWREKLVDRFGAQVMRRVVTAMLQDEMTLESALSAAGVSGGLSYLRQWDGERRKVNYRLGRVEAGGDETGPYLDVEILREGDQEIQEPVTVSARGATGTETQVWDEEGGRGVVRLRGALDPASVVVDPGYRLMETDLGKAVDPRWDNFAHVPWKVLLNGFAFQASTATGRINTSVFGSAKRAHDLSHRFSASAYDGERAAGVGAGWSRGLGSKLRANQRSAALSLGLGASWLKPQGGSLGGLSVGGSVGVGYSSVVSRVDPRSGTRAGAQLGSSLALIDGQNTLAFITSAGVSRLLDLGGGHVLGGRLSWASQWGDPRDNQKLGVGGRSGVRGVAPFALTGKHRLSASLEWRHPFTRDLSIGLLKVAWFEGIDGVLFVDTAGLGEEPGDLGDAASWSLGVGYGFRFHYLFSGVNPMVLFVDLGIPIGLAGDWSLLERPQAVVLTGLGQSF